MENEQKISNGVFAVFAIFFVFIYVVFLIDSFKGNFSSEESMKKNSFIFSKSTFKLKPLAKKCGKPDRDIIYETEGWLFYRPHLDALKNDKLNHRAIDEIVSMQEKLSQKGIKLIVLPVPLKAQVHSKKLIGSEILSGKYKKYIDALAKNNIDHIDLSELLKFEGSYLKTDTHWSPQAVDKVAKALRKKLNVLSLERSLNLREKLNLLVGWGNLSKSLTESVSIQQVKNEQELMHVASGEGEVLILGDSFSNIYSVKSLGWSTGAGLAVKLSYQLQHPVDKIAVDNGGASGSRKLLMEELASGYDRLKNKKCVIWEFNFNAFTNDEWLHFDFPEKRKQEFLKVEKEVEVQGKILEMSHMKLNSVYKDELVSIRMKVGEKQVLFRSFFKKDNSETHVAKLKVGDAVKVKLSPLTNEVLKVSRSEFLDLDLQLQAYSFGEVIEKKTKFNLAKWNFYLVLIFSGLLCIRISRRDK